ncbi:MAG: hypothetical protein ACOCUC_01040 [bacterium]
MAKIAKSQNEIEADPAKVRLYLPNDEKMIEGLGNVGPGKNVTMKIRGSVKSFNNMEYMEGADIEVEPTSVTIEADEEIISLDDAIEAGQKKA